MTKVDWIALGAIALAALFGLRKGLLASVLSLVGIVAGAMLGARLAPSLLAGGSRSPWTPIVALAGACIGAIALETVGSIVGRTMRGALVIPPFRALDSLGGAVVGAAAGLVAVWLVGAGALLVPGQTDLRKGAQSSRVLRTLNDVVPPSRVLAVVARVDPLQQIAGPLGPVAAPDPSVLRDPAVRRAAPSVVRILGTACGLGVEGSGWVGRPGLVVTAAHVVAGQHDTVVQPGGIGPALDAQVVVFDSTNDLAVLRVRDLRARALRLGHSEPDRAVAILGYPGNGPFTATPGRIGNTSNVVSRDAYGHGPVARLVTTIRGKIRRGNSGGPAVDSTGAVQATVFASRVDGSSGFGIPFELVREALAKARGPVSSGRCA